MGDQQTALVHKPEEVAVAPNGAEFLPVMDIAIAKERRRQVLDFAASILTKDEDFGVIPGTVKPTLLQPGAQKLCSFFGLEPDFETVEEVKDWTGQDHGGEPFFYFKYKYFLKRGGKVLGVGLGSINSWESKYRYRWVSEANLPDDTAVFQKRDGSITEPDFAINKAETTGKWGKPAEHWQRFRDAISRGEALEGEAKTKAGKPMKTWTIPATEYRIPNPDIFDQVNTFEKMALKRAYIMATLNATGASELYTQDLEDTHGIDTGPHQAGTQAAADYVRDQKLAGDPPTSAQAGSVTQPATGGKAGATSEPAGGGTQAPTDPPELQKILAMMVNEKGRVDKGNIIEILTKAKAAIQTATGSFDDFNRILGEYGMASPSDLKGKKMGQLRELVRKLWQFATEYEPPIEGDAGLTDEQATAEAENQINPEDFHEPVETAHQPPEDAELPFEEPREAVKS